ncbi:hypothetical protein HMPREF2528_05720 [Rothia sp. HMSC078H08]|uniref:restriction endonuclease subunit S n=1 Tax=Rothia sp. HMSC078H08 TaxID=1715008 RepID=UPI0008A40500|nr:restriction endonuclease subunit S [Rothia sp. HMSC078H08]OFN72402.1 hypothetical protein HMPREF2528_05720 [Rothia sp. HMSC078H08]
MAVLSDAQREAGWTIVKLGDICAFVAGSAFPQKEQGKVSGDYPFAKVKDLQSAAGLSWRNIDNWIEESQLKTLKSKIIPVKSIVFAKIGEGLKRERFAMSSIPMCIDNNLMAAVPSAAVNNIWLYYKFKTLNISSLVAGSALPYLRVQDLKDLDISLPPLEEQERIAGILGSLDDKIEANTRLIQTLDSLGEAATRKYLKSVQKTQKLNDIAHIVMGQSPKGETLNTEGSGVLFFQGKKDFGFRYPTPRTYTTAATRMAEPLDILFSVRAPIGALNRSVEACCVGRGLAAIRSSCGQENTLFYTLKTNPNLWEKFEGEGTIFSAINKKGLSELDIPFSETAISNGVEDFLTSVEQEIFSLEQENLQLAETRDALIKRLIG